ncbi:hypothetical protein HMPREF9420_1826 [Segatella salivae DSM 15606]|uniref:Uncharacterized protein n=1 Tax=Segatella salivae DSM 15606 TaxID=888832 RepID=E6MQQ8_9BACT|nr:hypothetical protein HMPREF9420_1826 [Segatella salivae DSM 15606]
MKYVFQHHGCCAFFHYSAVKFVIIFMCFANNHLQNTLFFP